MLQVTTVARVIEAAANRVDVIIAQGTEAGGNWSGRATLTLYTSQASILRHVSGSA